MSGRVVIIAQSRSGSTRLPGKAFLKLQCGMTPTEFLLRALKNSRRADEIVLAVPDGPADDRYAAVASEADVSIFRGSEDDVLDRYYRAATAADAGVVVRVCGDNPLTDPEIIDRSVEAFLGGKEDYLSIVGLPLGTFGEVFSMDALARAQQECADPRMREHVTMYIYSNPDAFHIGQFDFALTRESLRVTIDTRADFDAVDALITRLGGRPPIPVARVVKALQGV